MTPLASGIILARSVPDDGMSHALIDETGRCVYLMPNQMRLSPKLLEAFDLENQLVWFPSDPPIGAAGLTGVINLCTDPWAYRKALKSIHVWAANHVLIFNHPIAVVRTQEAKFFEHLSRIHGLEIARKVGLFARRPEDFTNAVKQAKLKYPVRVQAATSPGNAVAMLVHSDRDWPGINKINWPGRAFVITEVPPDHLTGGQRWRVGFVGRDAEVATFTFSYEARQILPAQDPMAMQPPPEIQRICRQIFIGIGLDHWSVEFSLGEGGCLRLEHLWAGLPEDAMLQQDDPSVILRHKLSARLDALLLAPERWRASAETKNRKARVS